MPSNSSTVVMQENVEEENNSIRIIKHPSLGDNCRLAGEDIAKAERIFDAGKKISSKTISLLAAVGKSSVQVKKKLRVGYFTSGNELLNPSENISGSNFFNSSRYNEALNINMPLFQ